jgi:hypothetical protein
MCPRYHFGGESELINSLFGRNLVPFFDRVDGRMPNTEDPQDAVYNLKN